ncbi:MAG: prepilin peptidase [Parcubacteria group bacterium]|nr:prepilin peptidase [Parcubacteria group bacterium]
MEMLLPILTYCLVFFFGAIIGSFLNVVIFRYHSGATFLGRSMCFSCGKTLRFHDLVPVFSFLALRGKCRFCLSKISCAYAIVEAATGGLFALLLWKTGGFDAFVNAVTNGGAAYFVNLALLAVLVSLLAVIAGYDIKHKIIPDAFAYAFAGLALFRLAVLPEVFTFAPTVWDFAAGAILALPFAALWYVSGGRWMGLGDAKLALGIGWFLGLRDGITAVILAFWIGAVFGLALIGLSKLSRHAFFRRHATMKSEIPFAPFLIAGLLLVFTCSHVTDFLMPV